MHRNGLLGAGSQGALGQQHPALKAARHVTKYSTPQAAGHVTKYSTPELNNQAGNTRPVGPPPGFEKFKFAHAAAARPGDGQGRQGGHQGQRAKQEIEVTRPQLRRPQVEVLRPQLKTKNVTGGAVAVPQEDSTTPAGATTPEKNPSEVQELSSPLMRGEIKQNEAMTPEAETFEPKNATPPPFIQEDDLLVESTKMMRGRGSRPIGGPYYMVVVGCGGRLRAASYKIMSPNYEDGRGNIQAFKNSTASRRPGGLGAMRQRVYDETDLGKQKTD